MKKSYRQKLLDPRWQRALVSMCWQCHQQTEDDLKFLSEAFRTVNPDRLSKIVLAIHKYNTIRSKKKKKLALDLWLESLSKALARF